MAINWPYIYDGVTQYDFLSMRGAPREQATEVTIQQRPGIDGATAIKSTKRASMTTLDCAVDLDTAELVTARRAALIALIGSAVSWRNAIGEVFENYILVDVQPAGEDVLVSPVGGVNGGAYVLRVRLVMQATETT